MRFDGTHLKINAEGAFCHKNQGEARARVKGHVSMRESRTSLIGTKHSSFGHQLLASAKGLFTFMTTCTCQRDVWKAYVVEVRWWTQKHDGTWTHDHMFGLVSEG